MNNFFLIILLCAFGLSSLHAQELVTDRPDFTESALAIPARMIQIESGAEFVRFNSLEEWTYPNALARIGVGYNLELRLGFSGWNTISSGNQSNTYLNDILLEAKYQFTKEDALVPFAILVVSTLPTGAEEVSVGKTEAGLVLSASYGISDQFDIGLNLGAISAESKNERVINSVVSLALGIGLNEKLGAYVEIFAEIPQNETWQPVLDGGLTYLVHPTAQLDFYVGKGLNKYAPDLIVGTGFSFRFNY